MDDKTRTLLIDSVTKVLSGPPMRPIGQLAREIVEELEKHWPATMTVKGKGRIRFTKVRPGHTF